MSLFINYLRSLPIYAELCAANPSSEGNLFERPVDDLAAEAQIEFLRLAIAQAQPMTIVETGTNKALFALFLAHTLHDAVLYTFDKDERAGRCAALVNGAFPHVRIIFTLGDTKKTLPAFAPHAIDLAWVDGGHNEATAYSDISVLMDRKVPFIAIDDTKSMPSVAPALARALVRHPDYRRQPNHPWWICDVAGAVLVERTRA